MVIAGLAIVVSIPDRGFACRPDSGGPGKASFSDLPGDAVGSDLAGAYAGTFDRDGNFSFSTGTQRRVRFTLGPPLALLGNQPTPPGATPSSGLKDEVTFDVLAQSGGGTLLTIQPGAPEARSVRFLWPNKDGGTQVTTYGLHFRGNALLDDDGDGVANEPYPEDGTEMSKMLTTCTAAESGRCVSWSMRPCQGDCPGDGANPDSPADSPVGQIYATFRKPAGTRPIARFEMPWGISLCRVTATNPCP
jgi:hypothetical protein